VSSRLKRIEGATSRRGSASRPAGSTRKPSSVAKCSHHETPSIAWLAEGPDRGERGASTRPAGEA
jgi:hypothetical protein